MIKLLIENKNSVEFYLINLIYPNLKKKPLFITDDATFGVNYFKQWKLKNGKENWLCQVEPIEFIDSKAFAKTDIQTKQIGVTNGN